MGVGRDENSLVMGNKKPHNEGDGTRFAWIAKELLDSRIEQLITEMYTCSRKSLN
jgi:hypothetical protein